MIEKRSRMISPVKPANRNSAMKIGTRCELPRALSGHRSQSRAAGSRGQWPSRLLKTDRGRRRHQPRGSAASSFGSFRRRSRMQGLSSLGRIRRGAQVSAFAKRRPAELSEDGHVEGQTGQAETSQARDCASARSPEPVALFCETSHSKIMVRRRLLAELGARPCLLKGPKDRRWP